MFRIYKIILDKSVSYLSLYCRLLGMFWANSRLISYDAWHYCLLSSHYWRLLCDSLIYIVWVGLLSNFWHAFPHWNEIGLSLGIWPDDGGHIIFLLLLQPLLVPNEYALGDYEHLHCAAPTIQCMIVDTFQRWMLPRWKMVWCFLSRCCSLFVIVAILSIIFPWTCGAIQFFLCINCSMVSQVVLCVHYVSWCIQPVSNTGTKDINERLIQVVVCHPCFDLGHCS